MKHSLKEVKVLYQSLLFITLYIVVVLKLDNVIGFNGSQV